MNAADGPEGEGERDREGDRGVGLAEVLGDGVSVITTRKKSNASSIQRGNRRDGRVLIAGGSAWRCHGGGVEGTCRLQPVARFHDPEGRMRVFIRTAFGIVSATVLWASSAPAQATEVSARYAGVLDTLVARELHELGGAGRSSGVVKDESSTRGFGVRDVESGAPVTPDMLFHVGP